MANYFGFFVGHHYYDIKRDLGLPSVFDTAAPTTVAKTSPPVLEIEEKEAIHVVTNLATFKVPTICFENGTKAEKINGDILNGKYKIIARAVGCDLESWYLVQTESGKSGWVKSILLDTNKKEIIQVVSKTKKHAMKIK